MIVFYEFAGDGEDLGSSPLSRTREGHRFVGDSSTIELRTLTP